jgi:S1-C subfamily serine protease
MAFPRLPDWVVYGAVVATMVVVSTSRREHADAPPAPPPPGPEEGALVGPSTPFDPTVVVDAPADPAQPVSGTAFAVAGDGRWLTARHVVEGCRQAAILLGGGRAVEVKIGFAPKTDVAVLTSLGGPPALPIRPERASLRIGQRAYHPGFPQGQAGEVTSRLLGREILRVKGRGAHAEPVLAWAETGRTDQMNGSLSGLSGAPALDAQGRVVGVTLAESPRRGRIYTTAPESVAAAVAPGAPRSEAGEPAPSEPITPENYGRMADALRRDLRVAQVVCLKT